MQEGPLMAEIILKIIKIKLKAQNGRHFHHIDQYEGKVADCKLQKYDEQHEQELLINPRSCSFSQGPHLHIYLALIADNALQWFVIPSPLRKSGYPKQLEPPRECQPQSSGRELWDCNTEGIRVTIC